MKIVLSNHKPILYLLTQIGLKRQPVPFFVCVFFVSILLRITFETMTKTNSITNDFPFYLFTGKLSATTNSHEITINNKNNDKAAHLVM